MTSDKVNEKTQTWITREMGLESFFFHFSLNFFFISSFHKPDKNTNHVLRQIKKNKHTHVQNTERYEQRDERKNDELNTTGHCEMVLNTVSL